jgi:hypothetical protein
MQSLHSSSRKLGTAQARQSQKQLVGSRVVSRTNDAVQQRQTAVAALAPKLARAAAGRTQRAASMVVAAAAAAEKGMLIAGSILVVLYAQYTALPGASISSSNSSLHSCILALSSSAVAGAAQHEQTLSSVHQDVHESLLPLLSLCVTRINLCHLCQHQHIGPDANTTIQHAACLCKHPVAQTHADSAHSCNRCCACS